MSEQNDIGAFMDGLRSAISSGQIREGYETLSTNFSMLEERLGKYHPTVIQALCMLGNFQYALEEPQGAITCFIEARSRTLQALYENHPVSYEIYWGLARVYEYQSLFREASHFYLKAAELRASLELPDGEPAVDLYVWSGQALEKQNCFAEAIQVYELALAYLSELGSEAAPEDYSRVYSAMGASLLSTGQTELAIASLEEALALPSEDMTGERVLNTKLLGDAYSLSGNMNAAMEAWQDAFSFLNPTDPQHQSCWLELGTSIADCLFQQEHELESLEHLRGMLTTAVELSGNPISLLVPLHQQLAEGYFHLRMYEAAKEHLMTALKLEEMRTPVSDENLAKILYGVGLIGLRDGTIDDAITSLTEALERIERVPQYRPDVYAKICHSLGWAHHFLKQSEEAQKYYHKAIELQRDKGGTVFLDTEELLERLHASKAPLPADEDSGEPTKGRMKETKLQEVDEIRMSKKTAVLETEQELSGRNSDAPRLDQLFHSATLAVDQRKYAEAARMLSEILKLLERHEGKSHPDLIPVLDLLALVNTNLGQHHEANALRARAGSIQAEYARV